MTWKRVAIVLEVDSRAGENPEEWARALVRESGNMGQASVVGARWLETNPMVRARAMAKALHEHLARCDGPVWDPWELIPNRDRDRYTRAMNAAILAGDVDPPGAAIEGFDARMGSAREEVDRAGDLLMTAWAIIANANATPIDELAAHPYYGTDKHQWGVAAARWREEFHAWLAGHPGAATPEVSALVCGAVSAAGTVCHEVGFHKEHEGRFPAVVEVHDPAAGDVHAKRLRLVERWPA